MAFDISELSGVVNSYLNSISSTSKLLNSELENDQVLNPGSGLFEKYFQKALGDEAENQTTISGAASDTAQAVQAAASASPQQAKSSMNSMNMFPQLDIQGEIAQNIEAHNRLRAIEGLTNSSLFYSNMIQSSIFTGSDMEQ